jgi:3-oxoacyl-[acyl-carrier protein] reductase
MDLGLAGRAAIVTGSSRGVGLGVAHALAAEGCRVMLTGRDAGALARARDGFPDAAVTTFAGDLSRAETLAAAAAEVVDRWGAIDILVANIGSGTGRSGWALDEHEWEASFELNLHASRRAADAILPHMTRAGRGSVVFISSIVSLEAVNAPLPYSAAKTALNAYAINLARAVARGGIRVNVVAPGNVLFEGGSWSRKLNERPEQVRAYIDAEVPLGRFGSPEDIGNLVAFLASDRASFVTGACFVADGGQTRGYR